MTRGERKQPVQRQYLEALFTNTPNAIITIDQHFHVLDCNPAAASTLGWTETDIHGRLCSDILKCRNLNGMLLCGTSSCPLQRVIQSQEPLANESLLLGTIPNHTHEYSISVTPVHVDHSDDSDSDSGVVFSARDMSAVHVANHLRANFVSMVSHELRTPLNSVHGFIDLLVQGHIGSLTEEQRMYLGYSQEGVQQLISIVETGYDILIEDQPHIFERFYQADHHLQSTMGGYGLGLSIAKLIVEQHGGHIGFDTIPGKGTTFYFTAPLYVASHVL